MVAIQVLDKLDDAPAEGFNDGVYLLRRANKFDHFLQSASAVRVESNSNHVFGRVLNHRRPLIIVAELEKLLAQIVAKGIRHEFYHMFIGFKPDDVDLFGVALLQFLLKVAAAVLVFAKFVDLALEGLERHVVVTRHDLGGQ